jgi:hypothetical protein
MKNPSSSNVCPNNTDEKTGKHSETHARNRSIKTAFKLMRVELRKIGRVHENLLRIDLLISMSTPLYKHGFEKILHK